MLLHGARRSSARWRRRSTRARPAPSRSSAAGERSTPALVVRDPARSLERAGARGRDARRRRSTPTTSHCVIHTSGTGGRAEGRRAHLRQPPLERARLRRADRRRARRPLALLPAAAPHRRAARSCCAARSTGSPVVLEPFDAERGRRALIERQRVTIVSLVPTMLARLLDAGAAARAPALRADRRRAAAAGADRARARRRRAGRADLRAHRGGLPGRDDAARRGARAARLAPGRRSSPPRCGSTTTGVICVRGPSVAPGERGRGRLARTGDLGRIDEDGLPVRARARRRRDRHRRRERLAGARWSRCCSSTRPSPTPAVHGREDPEWQQAVVATVVLADGRRRERGGAARLLPRAARAAQGAEGDRRSCASCRATRRASCERDRLAERRLIPCARPCQTSTTRTTPTSRRSRARPSPCSATAPRATPTR